MLNLNKNKSTIGSLEKRVRNGLSSLEVEFSCESMRELGMTNDLAQRLCGKPARDPILKIDPALGRHSSGVLAVILKRH